MNLSAFAGHLSSGEAFYGQKKGGFAVEKEHFWLVKATSEETEEIYKIMPYLRPAMEAES